MFTTLVNRLLLIYESIRTFFSAMKQIVIWAFTVRPVRYLIYFMVLILISWVAGFFYFINSIDKNWEDLSNNNDLYSESDAIIVLTGGSERVRHALHILDQGISDKLFISGVNKEVKLKELLEVHKVTEKGYHKFAERIQLGFQASDTVENAEEISEWVTKNKISSVRLITSNYHIDRALMEIKNKIDDEVKIIPHPVIPINVRIDKWWNFSGTRGLLLREYNKMIYAFIRIKLENIGISI